MFPFELRDSVPPLPRTKEFVRPIPTPIRAAVRLLCVWLLGCVSTVTLASSSAATGQDARTDSLVAVARDLVQFDTYDRHLRALSGYESTTIAGEEHTLVTRYAPDERSDLAWIYAYERLDSLGLDVRYERFNGWGRRLSNVVARIEGEVTPQTLYVLGAHIDAQSIDGGLSPGAEDNASGAAAILAAAEALSGARFESTIELVLFMAEELGQLGSAAYVQSRVAEGWNVAGAIVLDMIAYIQRDPSIRMEGLEEHAPLMNVFVDEARESYGLRCLVDFGSFGSDHVPFHQAGIPAFVASDADWSRYIWFHSSQDTYDHTMPERGHDFTRIAVATLTRLAGPIDVAAPAPPAESPRDFALHAVPNPAVAGTELRLDMSNSGSLTRPPSELRIIDVQGRSVLLRRIPGGDSAQAASWDWDLRDDAGRHVPAGSYWVSWEGRRTRVTVLR